MSFLVSKRIVRFIISDSFCPYPSDLGVQSYNLGSVYTSEMVYSDLGFLKNCGYLHLSVDDQSIRMTLFLSDRCWGSKLVGVRTIFAWPYCFVLADGTAQLG